MLRYPLHEQRRKFAMTAEEYAVAKENYHRENPIHKLRWRQGINVYPGGLSVGFSIKIPFPEYSTLGKIWMAAT